MSTWGKRKGTRARRRAGRNQLQAVEQRQTMRPRAAQFEGLEDRLLLTATALGNEYQVNTVVAADQRAVAIGSNPHATQVIVAWTSTGEDASGSDGVYAQRYDLNGARIGSAFRVNVTTAGNQNAPAVAMDSLGDFVIVWQTAGQDGSGDAIYGRRFGYDATPLATEFRVNSTTAGNQQAPAIAMNDNGAFAVAFQSASRDSSGNAVVARVFNSSGTALANDFQVNQFTSGNQQAPSIAMDASGQFVVSWQSAAQDGNGDAIVARRYSSTGTALAAEFAVNQTVTGNQSAPSIAANSDGSFVIAWQSAGQDGSGDAIVARRYNAAGAAAGNEFVVNQFTSGNQSAPSISAAIGTGFVVSWQSAGQDGNSDAVVARQYAADGTAAGNEFVANTFVTGAQNNPWVAMEGDGDFIVAWQSPGQETGGSTSLGVFARRYSAANDAPVMREIANQIADVGGTISFVAKADDQDAAIDSLTYSLAPGAPAAATINPTTGAFSWSTASGVAPGRYFVTVEAHDLAGLVDRKEVAITVFAPGERTALDDYVNAIDPAYKWDIRSRTIGDGFIKYDVLLTSGTWRTSAEVNKPLWQHWMEVYVPNEVTQSKALLFIDGGDSSSTPPTGLDFDSYAGPIAASVGAIFIDLLGVPSEPLLFAGESTTRTEDAIIAYSWSKYLATGDPTWIANLPMTRSAVRAMDAVSDFLGSPVGGNIDLDSFVVSGGSKRGWTTWLASAVDPRVSEEVPIVSDLLNMELSFEHHYAYYNGTFSAAVQDYVNAGVLKVNNFGLDSFDKLLAIVDPYSYLERLTLPKYLVNVSGDEFFVPDSSQFYYNQLIGPKAMRYLPNSSHGISDQTYLAEILNVYVDMFQDVALPEYTFQQLADGTIELATSETVVDARLWKATNANARDFRWPVVGAAYTSTPLTDQGGGVYRGNVPVPTKGYTAYFVEATIEVAAGVQIKVTSSIYLKGNPPTNLPPDLAPINDVVVPEGSPLAIPLSAIDADTSQTLRYSFDFAVPPQVTINPTTGVISGLWNDQVATSLSIVASVWDNGTPNLPDRDTFLITVVNVAPTASLGGPATSLPGQSQTFTLLATDPSSVDQAAGFTFKLDWDGDGVVDQTVVGPSGTTVGHVFGAGSFSVRLTATDKDGGISNIASSAINVNSPPVDPFNQQPITVLEGDSLLLQAVGWTDPENDPLTYAWDVDGDGQFDDATGATATLTWNDLVALGLGDGDLTRQLRVRVDDGHGGATVSGQFALLIANAPPTADAGGPYVIYEGESLTLFGLGTDPAGAADPLTYSWDINGDLNFDDAVGAHPTLSWTQLVALGIGSGPSALDVRLRVSDGDGGVTDSTVTLLSVNNANPVAGISGPSTALRGEPQTYTLTATDPSSEDQSVGFIFSIDWGDGSPAQVVAGQSGTTVPHGFNIAGPVTVRVTATDQDDGISAAATKGVSVDAMQLRPNAQNAALVDLVWGGSNGDDQVELVQTGPASVRVHESLLNGAAVGNTQEVTGITGRVIALGSQGNDLLDARGLLTKQATLNGNAGNNTLYGGSAGDILIGGSNGGEGKQGNNVIIAGNGDNTIYGNDINARTKSSGGNNLIVGGSGHDTVYGNFGANPTGNGGEGGQNLIVGGGGSDTIYASQVVDGAEGGHGSILVAGSTSLGQAALLSVLSEWTSTRTMAAKIANIEGIGTGPRNNGSDFLQPGSTVFDDGSMDDLYSDTKGAANWLLLGLGPGKDTPNRAKANDIQTDTP